MDIHNSQFGADIEYKTLDIGTPAWAIKPGPDAILPIPLVPGIEDATEDFEGPLWTQIALDSGDWTLETDQSHSPTHSYKSKDIGNNQTTSFTIQNNSFQEQISFWLKTDTEAGFDKFRVFIDAVEVYVESGNNDWHRVAVPTDFGYLVEFRYSKDFSSSTPADACWVDDLAFGTLDTPEVPGSPAHPFVYAPLQVNEDGELLVSGGGGSGGCCSGTATSTLTNIPANIASVTLSAANANRLGWMVFNDSTDPLLVKFGAVASATSFTVYVRCGGYFEMPNPTLYTGVIDGIWLAATGGVARITELS